MANYISKTEWSAISKRNMRQNAGMKKRTVFAILWHRRVIISKRSLNLTIKTYLYKKILLYLPLRNAC